MKIVDTSLAWCVGLIHPDGRTTKSDQLTPAELELMNILWQCGVATVQAVVARLPEHRKLAYTTVQTVLNVLHRKGKVKRTYFGRAYHYEPMITRTGATASAIRELVNRLFGGVPERLVAAMIETEQLTPEKINELQRILNATRMAARKSGNDSA